MKNKFFYSFEISNQFHWFLHKALTCGWDFLSCVAAILSGCSFLSSSGRSLIGILSFHFSSLIRMKRNYFCFFLLNSFNGFFNCLSKFQKNPLLFFVNFILHCFPVFLIFFFCGKTTFFSVFWSSPLIGGTSTTLVFRCWSFDYRLFLSFR